EAVGEAADKRSEDSHQQHGGGGGEGEQFTADMQLSRDRLQENAEALAHAKANGQHEEAANDGGPIRTGGHSGNLRRADAAFKLSTCSPFIELLHAATSSDVAQITMIRWGLGAGVAALLVLSAGATWAAPRLDREHCTFKPPRLDHVECYELTVLEN